MKNANINTLAAVTENIKKAEPKFDEILRAAEAGDAEAQYELGNLFSSQYADDYAVNAEAVRWYERAALQGHATAQWVLAYDSTEGLDRDAPPLRNAPEEAWKWMRMAAEQEHPEAIRDLTEMYGKGLSGVKRPPQEAADWFLRVEAWEYLVELLMNENVIISAEDQGRLIKSVRNLVESNNWLDQFTLGNLLAIGLPMLAANEEEAIEWHNRAAEQLEEENRWHYFPDYNTKALDVFQRHPSMCSAMLCRRLARTYEEGKGVEINQERAAQWYELAAEKGDVNSQWAAALRYDQGVGVEKNDHAAAKWYREAAEQGLATAQNNLGVMYDHGRGVVPSHRMARHWFKRAAAQDDETALYNLGVHYLDGLGVKTNERIAAKWFRKSSNLGYVWASVALAALTGKQCDLTHAVEELFNAHKESGLSLMLDRPEQTNDFMVRLEQQINGRQLQKDEMPFMAIPGIGGRDRFVRALHGPTRVSATLLGMLAEASQQESKYWFELAFANGDAVATYYLAHRISQNNPNESDYDIAIVYLDQKSGRGFFSWQRSLLSDESYSPEFITRINDLKRELRENMRISQEREKAREQQLSFLSHTLSNASAGAQDTIRRAARLLGTVQADKPETLRRAMERLSGQIASLALIETLVASFKLYAADPERVRESWDNEQAGDIAFVRVLALALRQVLTRLFTLPGHALDLRRLLPENGETLAQEFVADIMVLDLESDAEAARLIAWVQDKLPFLELLIEDDASMRFAQGGARFVVTFAVLAEILTNAVKYASAPPISLACGLAQRQMRIVCRNRVQARPPQALDSGGTGITFLREICRIVGADIHDSLDESGQFEVVLTAKA